MGRKADPARRAELLAAVVDHLLQDGLQGASLRPLAAAVGTTPRVLLYHFGSKEELIAEVLVQARAREQQLVVAALRRATPSTAAALAREVWRQLSSVEFASFYRFYFEVHGRALMDPSHFEAFLEDSVGAWLPVLAGGLGALGVPRGRAMPVATLVLATCRGLLLDLLATGDRRRTTKAFDEFVAALGPVLDSSGRGREPRRTVPRRVAPDADSP